MESEFIKEKSYMLAIPKHEEELRDIDLVMSRIRGAEDFTVTRMGLNDEGMPVNEIEYNGDTYKFEIYPEEYRIPEMFRVQHFFKDIDVEAIDKQSVGLIVALEFSDNILESYHLQLKIIAAIFPETLGIIDYSAEKILSGAWASLAAKSSTPPAPRYIFTTQAVYSGDDDVWLHTHGLNRCGIMELEVINSTKETSQNHYHVIESVASRLIDEHEIFKKGEAMYVARFCNNQPLVVTWVPWQQAMDTVREGSIGGYADRTDEGGHNGYTGSLFVYATQADMDNDRYTHLSIYDDLLKNNPMFMLTNEETARMRSLAMERVSYMKKAFMGGAKVVLVKVGLIVDDEYKTETNEREHIWFELKSVSDSTFTAELTQEPYMVSGMHTGDVGTYTYDFITDWMVFTEEDRISPDEVYLMEEL